MITNFAKEQIDQLQAMWPEGVHFPTISWSSYGFTLTGKKFCYRSGKCPLKLYDTEIQERYAAAKRDSEEDYFLPNTEWNGLLNWYQKDWSKFTYAMDTIAQFEADNNLANYSKKKKNEGGC